MRKTSLILSLLFFSVVFAQKANVLTGIDVLKLQNFKSLEGLRIGLITNQTGLDNELNSTIDILHQAENVSLTCLFGPEHGVRGNIDAGKKVSTYKDPDTGLPVYSLYGSTRKPTAEMLKNVDALVYDIQDIGCRSYTFISTMGLAMEAAAENGKKFFVLDRPNPLGGVRVEGNYPDEKYKSFISQYSIPYIYGLTCGELALMINQQGWLKNKVNCELQIIKMQNWKREYLFQDLNLIWIPTSPHIPKVETVQFYPATGIIGELRSQICIGVGYTIPFEMILAENIDSKILETELNKFYKKKGVIFRATSVIPYYSRFSKQHISGVQIHITDPNIKNIMLIQFKVMLEIIKKNEAIKNFISSDSRELNMFDKAIGSDEIRKFLLEGSLDKIEKFLNKDVEHFLNISKNYHLY